MKVAITAKTNSIESEIDTRFGRCGYFLIIDTDNLDFRSINNSSAMASGGAGIKAAQTIANTGVKVVITDNIGPNAFETLKAADIKIYKVDNGTIKDVIAKYKNGELEEIKSASVGNHFGMKV